MRLLFAKSLVLLACAVAPLHVAGCASHDDTPSADAQPAGWYAGTLRTDQGDEPIRYQLKNGRALYQGDIVLTREEARGGARPDSFAMGSPADVLHGGGLWPNSTIPYRFDPAIPPDMRAAIQRQLWFIEIKTAVAFVPDGTATAADYVYFDGTGDACDAPLGHHPGANVVHLPPSHCNMAYPIVHEIGHILGLRHEISRPDRDTYVTVHYENIALGARPIYDKQAGVPVGAFDFDSAVLAPPRDSATEIGGDPITAAPGYFLPSPSQMLSPGDLAGVATLYPLLVDLPQTFIPLWQGAMDIPLPLNVDMNQWPSSSVPVNVWLSDLPFGVSATSGGDAYGLHQYLEVSSNAPPVEALITVNASQGATTFKRHVLISIQATSPVPPLPPPNAPDCTYASTCDNRFVPADKGVPAHYETRETVTTTCPYYTPDLVLQTVSNGIATQVADYRGNLSYPEVTPNKFDIGGQNDIGQTTSGAPVGSTVAVQACRTSGGSLGCDPATTITVKSCCTPATCTETMCGTVSNGCGGTIQCTAGCGKSCAPKTCPKGYAWSTTYCDCESTCSTPKACCIQGGGTWTPNGCE